MGQEACQARHSPLSVRLRSLQGYGPEEEGMIVAEVRLQGK